jgi:dihydroxyacetone kinase-like protein
MTQSALDAPAVKQMLLAVADRIIAAEPILSEADRHLGDGDHGIGMSRGFAAAKAKLEATSPASIASVFQTAGSAMLTSMGGASGALFATLFRNGAKALEDRTAFDAAALADFLAASLSGVRARGGAKAGQKTMIDALEPAAAKAGETRALTLPEAATAVAAAAEAGKEATKSMRATAGRATALGDASIGHADPGAISVCLILAGLRDYIIGSVE